MDFDGGDYLNNKFDQTLKEDKSPKNMKKRRKSSFLVGNQSSGINNNPPAPSPIYNAAKKSGASPKALAIKKNRRMSEAPANIMRFNLKVIK